MTLRIGSLFSGYGGLELGIAQVLDAETVWHSEIERAPSRILEHHWPTVPNLGDVTAIDWAAAPPVDVLCGGFPCQDVSTAGLRRGLRPGTRSGLWSHFAAAINALRPRLVVIENVRGLLSAEAHSDVEPDPWDLGGPSRGDRPALRALGAVLGDLADLGYDADWLGLRAADAGAPHGRFRVFVVARPATDTEHVDSEGRGRARDGRPEPADRARPAADAAHEPRPARHPDARVRPAADGRGGAEPRRRDRAAADADDGRLGGVGRIEPVERDAHRRDRPHVAWGPYEPAIRRWETAVGRHAPAPTEIGAAGGQRLSPRFVEWMMGLEDGHVTGIGLNRGEELKALGNGVVPQQAALAVRTLLAASTPSSVAGMSNQQPVSPTDDRAILARFRGVENSPPPTDEQSATVAEIRAKVLDLALTIGAADLHPRCKATALTDLESAAMFAVKGVFQTA